MTCSNGPLTIWLLIQMMIRHLKQKCIQSDVIRKNYPNKEKIRTPAVLFNLDNIFNNCNHMLTSKKQKKNTQTIFHCLCTLTKNHISIRYLFIINKKKKILSGSLKKKIFKTIISLYINNSFNNFVIFLQYLKRHACFCL